MVSYTASELAAFLRISTPGDVSVETMEAIIDTAIETLTLEGASGLSYMSGSAGSKTVSLTVKQRAAVLFVARLIYHSGDVKTVSAGGVTAAAVDLLADPEYARRIHRYAQRLSEVPFIVAEDTSGIE